MTQTIRKSDISIDHLLRAAARFDTQERIPPGFDTTGFKEYKLELEIPTGSGRWHAYPPLPIIAMAIEEAGYASPAPKKLRTGFSYPAWRDHLAALPGCRISPVGASGIAEDLRVEPAQLLREDVLDAIDKIDASGNARRVSNDLHKTAWRIPANGRWYSMLAVLQIALRRHGIATLDQLKAVLRPKDGELQAVEWRNQLERLGFLPQRGSSSPQDRQLGELDFAIRAKADPEELDLERFLEREDVPTEIRREGIARLTQGSFRQDLIAARHGTERCDVTGIAVPEVLRAGHIHRWADCKETKYMRRDPANGLLLAAHLDALFEKGLIIFADDGRLLVSPTLSPDDRRMLQIDEPRRLAFKPSERQCEYLARHRERAAREGKTGHA